MEVLEAERVETAAAAMVALAAEVAAPTPIAPQGLSTIPTTMAIIKPGTIPIGTPTLVVSLALTAPMATRATPKFSLAETATVAPSNLSSSTQPAQSSIKTDTM
jgi:hypothetical protein